MKRFVLLLLSLPVSWPALAHPGHGNTPLHALMHMFEEHGALLGLVFLVVLGSLIYRARHTRNRQSRRQDREIKRDSR